MKRTTFHLRKMDCPSEERMVRMRLDDVPGVVRLSFDLSARQVAVDHEGGHADIATALEELSLGATVLGEEDIAHETRADGDSVRASDADGRQTIDHTERRALVGALAINALLFVAELIAGLVVGSMGLVADSLDMLADALVYALSLAAVGGAMHIKKRLARASGYSQFALAALGLAEVVRRFTTPEHLPTPWAIAAVSLVALAGNVATLYLLRTARKDGAGAERPHLEASWIFTSNDVLANLLVMASAGLVWATQSQVPDLVAGAFIFLLVALGARRILALSR